VRVSAFAKINLSLRVLGVRRDGYHELRTIFQSIALHDTLTVRARRGPFALRCDDPGCPADETNLVWRAAEQAWAASGRRGALRDVEIRLTKRIPLRAGLGGGSSDAAATLNALGSLWRVKPAALGEIAAALGADVPYFLEGGTALGLDRGDLVYALVDCAPAWVTIALPTFGVSTADAFRWWDESAALTIEAAPRGITTEKERAGQLGNDLQGPVAARHPEIAHVVGALQKAGAFHAAMSGSGSALFGLFSREQAAARAARALAATGGRALVTRTINRAAYQRLAGIPAHRINLPFAPRSRGHS
jgi:4-diphosphocytidyl-2-C-methyl-D-erythritol kinase